MNDNTPTPAPLADGIYTWKAVQPCGPSLSVQAQVLAGRVTLYVTGEGADAQPARPIYLQECQPAYLAEVQAALSGCTPYGNGPVTFTPAAQPIGKARACQLHRIMSRLGLPSAAHYDAAARAVGHPVYSLAALSPSEARAVWAELCARFPQARTVTAA